MKTFTTACLAAALASSSLALNIARSEGQTQAPKVIQHDIQKRRIADPIQHDRLRRRALKTVSQSLDNEETLYFANVSVGTPAQNMRLHIDTGSSDMWVNVPNSDICTYKNQGYCDFAGTYNPNKSSTYEYLNSAFRISYADNSGAQGDYVTDNVEIGGVTLNGQQFGIGYQSNSQEGILGIGYPANEAINAVRGGRQYANVPAKMMQQGLINSMAFSLWLNDLDASTGSILFGGVNTEKYTGSLSTLPIIKTQGVYGAFYVALTGVGMDGNANSFGTTNTAVLLDSGSSLSYLPDNLTSQIFDQFGVTYDENQGAAFIDCSRANEQHSLDFTFSSPTIRVDMSELVIPIGEQNGQEICALGLAPAGSTTAVLGDTFLRSAYVVYDMSSNQISLAQTNFNSSTDNIMEITNSTGTSSGIPDATGVADAVSEVPTSVSGGGRLGTVSSSAAAAATPAPSRLISGLGAAGALAAGAVMML